MLGTAEDAADAAQETFIRVHRGLPGFEGRSSVSTWIYSIAANVCRNFLAKRKNAAVLVPEIADRPDPAPDFATRVQDQAVLGDALLGIPHDLRICVLLSDLIGFSYEQIAQALSIPVGTVKSRIFRARKSLIDVLKGQAVGGGTAGDASGSSGKGTPTDTTGS
jgi:RNA polymerase sigma-70 factor (ECF subfamily)